MLMLFAAALQATPALDADPMQAALTCRQAVVTGLASVPLETTVQFSYYAMQAARALPGNQDYFQRMAALPDSDTPGVSRDNAPQLRALCDQRFPAARGTGPVTLPAGAWERDLMCAGVATVLSGSARGYGERTGDTAPVTRMRAIAARFQPRVMAAMAAHGVDGTALRRVLGEQIFASLDLGNGMAVATACEAQP